MCNHFWYASTVGDTSRHLGHTNKQADREGSLELRQKGLISCSRAQVLKQIEMADGGRFSSKQLGLRIQKKVVGKFANKTIAKAFIDEDLGSLLDTLCKILNGEMKDSKKANKVIKNIIKITVKIGLLSVSYTHLTLPTNREV